MSNVNTADSLAAARTSITEGLLRCIEHSGTVAAQLDKTLVSLSAGALVFSMTFVGTFAPTKLLLPLLFLAWVAFGFCLVLVVFGIRTSQNDIRRNAQELDTALKQLDKDEPLLSAAKLTVKLTHSLSDSPKVRAFNNSAILAFVIGVILLGVFVGYNAWNGPKQPSRFSTLPASAKTSVQNVP